MARQRSARQRASDHDGLVVVGGLNVAFAAAHAGCAKRIVATSGHIKALQQAGIDTIDLCEVERKQLLTRFGAEGQSGIVSEVSIPQPIAAELLVTAAIDEGKPLVAVEEIQDPQNLGAVFRAVAALGGAGVVLTKQRTAPIAAATLRASAGTLFRVPYARVGGMPNWLLNVPDTIVTVATVARGGDRPQALASGAQVLVFGSEGAGLKQLTVKRCQQQVTIPMANAESMNLAQSVALLLWEVLR